MANIVHGVSQIRAEVHERLLKEFDFKIGGVMGKLLYLISAEDKKFKSGDSKPLKIKGIKIPPNNLISLCPYARNVVGAVIAIGEEIAMPIESERSADHCLFVAGIDGEIKKGDLVGVVTLTPVEPISG